jgi:hypothetical protein
MARTVNALGRNWSKHQMHGLLKALVDAGWSGEFFREHYTDGAYPDVPVLVLSDEVYFEMYHMSGRDPKTYRKSGKTMWKALCATIDSCPWAQEQGEKLPVYDHNSNEEASDEAD